MFVITKEFNGKRVSSIEHIDPFSQMRVLAGMILEISADPRFSIRIEVKPRPFKLEGSRTLSAGAVQVEGREHDTYHLGAFPHDARRLCEHSSEAES